jgi:dephospho-CoA kinase
MIIGLTGGIAAGKSTVREIFVARRDMPSFDADACARRLLDSDPAVAGAVQEAFGSRFLRADGVPDRGALREQVFRDPPSRHKLEAILHPLVRSEWQAMKDLCTTAGRDFLADIPLLFETGAEGFFDAVVVVGCSARTQLDRLHSRGLATEIAKAMLASQLPIGQKIAGADFVIWNDGSLAALGRQTESMANQIFPD